MEEKDNNQRLYAGIDNKEGQQVIVLNNKFIVCGFSQTKAEFDAVQPRLQVYKLCSKMEPSPPP